MSLWTRVTNAFRSNRLNGEIDEELQGHLEEAVASGRDPHEARKAFGSTLRVREESRDAKLATWLESLKSDCVFGWRQLAKNPLVSAAAIVSLGLAIGASTAAFRLVDAILLRPLPVQNADRLYFIQREYVHHGVTGKDDSFEYPMFRMLREQVKEQAELMAVSYTSQIDLTYGSDQDMERAYRQYVSGWTFGALGLKPAAGRLLTASDDVKPGAHPYAVLSYDYWTRRFNRDPKAVGHTFHLGLTVYEIVGVCGKGFTGTETGTMTDIFVPTMMNARAIENHNWGWFRAWALLKPDASLDILRDKLQAGHKAYRLDRVKEWTTGQTQQEKDQYADAPVILDSARAGVSGLQKEYRQPLAILGMVVLLVLLIACANVANLMTAQATTRSREMALRVSIGAGAGRLLQLVLVESALIAAAASILGAAFAWWAAPFAVSMISDPANPARLALPADLRVLGFSAALALGVTLLFGLVPALRAAGIKPMAVLRGSENPRSRHRVINVLTAAQMAFCILVLFVAGLFLTTFERLSSQPTGFRKENLLLLEAGAKVQQNYAVWDQTLQHLRQVKGVESAAMSNWPVMSGNAWASRVWISGRVRNEGLEPYFLAVSPGWMQTMGIAMIDGRDVRPDEMSPGAAIVNEEFAKRFFDGQNPVGRTFEQMSREQKLEPVRIVGYVRNAKYRDMREAVRPTVYVPFHSWNEKHEEEKLDWGTFIIRVGKDAPPQFASLLRRQIPQARPELRVSDITTQEQLVKSHTVRERLLAALSIFFAAVALILAGVGLFGVITYAMTQRRREIGIRIALGARAGAVARKVTGESFAMLLLGAALGLGAGIASADYAESLLFGVKASDPQILLAPALILLATALVAAIPPVIRAVRIDPAILLRTE